ncbi:glycerol uptake facilitator protein [Verrucomicrobium sp. GAS474]|uniref:MIP/aquaporin family protein n=1 Tax=Verrucomicrobium sp. GAS474 TaxID=1882831 RepID=UPI00087C8EBA|nr:aquaporin [Verrucomicrobium sp. GAS474]SDT99774.1 glycerol uptake facilitator protein [Verrucomicrobium sp. GAS474]
MKGEVVPIGIVPRWLVGEFVGTFLLVWFGCGSLCVAVAGGVGMGRFGVPLVWGLGVAAAIRLTAAWSGAHLNPAVTLSAAVWNGFPWRRVPGYWAAQLAGAMAASALLYLIFAGKLADFETAQGIVRGLPGSEASARVFGEYFSIAEGAAFAVEVAGTAVLLLVIGGVSEGTGGRRPLLAAALIGLAVAVLIALLGPLTMACFNPARDLGPRLVSSWAGWGGIPFRVNGWGWLTVYLIAPLLGALLGGGTYKGLKVFLR